MAGKTPLPPSITRRALLAVSGAALLAVPARATATGPTTLITWAGEGDFHGGFSGLELAADRERMIAVSDRGYAVQARLVRDAQGMLTGVERTGHFAMTTREGRDLTGDAADAEGLDWDGGDQFQVSFEGGRLTRVVRYALGGQQISQLSRDDRWQQRLGNWTLEALAVDLQGRAVVIPETPGRNGFTLFRQGSNGWDPLGTLPNDSDFRPVGADFGPDGALYLLERKFQLAFFGTRISRITPGDWSRREVLVETGYGLLDNHEGLSITEDTQGRLWATTISDDNYNRFQRTEIAEFLLRP